MSSSSSSSSSSGSSSSSSSGSSSSSSASDSSDSEEGGNQGIDIANVVVPAHPVAHNFGPPSELSYEDFRSAFGAVYPPPWRNGARDFSDQAWELLGSYIAQNDDEHLIQIDISRCRLTDSKMHHLFRKCTKALSLKTLELHNNEFGVDGIQSMVPFLKNSLSIETLSLSYCSIGDITASEHFVLPHLRRLELNHSNIRSIPSSMENYTNLESLWLNNNEIGGEGCRSIAKLLQNRGSRLRDLYLYSNNLGDDEAETLANSLKYNTSLSALRLGGNNFTEKGFTAFLKLLNDVSSIGSTYNSNHDLIYLELPESTDATIEELQRRIKAAIGMNETQVEAGRAKVIETQLDTDKRMELCHMQGIDYSYESIFANIEPILLPEVLLLVGGNHGHCELYRMLLATAPDLVSIVNRNAVVKQMIAENSARISALAAENLALNEELEPELMESAEAKHKMQRIAVLTAELCELNKSLASTEATESKRMMVDDENQLCGRKRERGDLQT